LFVAGAVEEEEEVAVSVVEEEVGTAAAAAAVGVEASTFPRRIFAAVVGGVRSSAGRMTTLS
jgi:hypothetical protein